ncbi:hypothetical protein KY285_020644 [Solanum tuberosum]|nr:hypothetical protein KY285_020644 [Solanum tuberosum]
MGSREPAGSSGPGRPGPTGEPDRYRSPIPKAPIPPSSNGTGSGGPVLGPVAGRGGPTRSPCHPYLRSNSFSGSLPPLCSRTTSHLRTIVLNGNQLEGPVPMLLLNCNSLEILDVGNNSIIGTFPTWLGTLQQLQVLILKSNKFHGPISACQTEFCFPMLRILDVSRNKFNGSLLPQVFKNFRAMIKLDDTSKGTI